MGCSFRRVFDGQSALDGHIWGGKIGRGELTARREARGSDEETERWQGAGEVVDRDGGGWRGQRRSEQRGRTRSRTTNGPDSDSGSGHSFSSFPSLDDCPLLLPEHRTAGRSAHPTLFCLVSEMSTPSVLGSVPAGPWKVGSGTWASVRGKTGVRDSEGKRQPRKGLEHHSASGERLSLVHPIAEQNWPMPSQPRRRQPEQGCFEP